MLDRTRTFRQPRFGLFQMMEALSALAKHPVRLPQARPWLRKKGRKEEKMCMNAAEWLCNNGYLVTRPALARRLNWDYNRLDSFLLAHRDLRRNLTIVRHPSNCEPYVLAKTK